MLKDQPYGFTWQMVDAIRMAALRFDGIVKVYEDQEAIDGDYELVPSDAGREAAALAAADAIEALLPPRTDAPPFRWDAEVRSFFRA
ncbi:MAG TPA: hypothetical protein VFJ16_08260 [Longimicrobium sp.]|nr:hypothetical protein [Longimicrobium sp.]